MRTTLLSVFLFLYISCIAGDLDNGWKYFITNNRAEARKSFINATYEPSTRAEASLGLTLINWMEGKEEETFAYFLMFFNSSSNPYPATYSLWSTILDLYSTQLTTTKLQFLETILSDTRANGTMKALANSSLGNYYELIRQTEKAKKHFAALGAITQWQLTGVFNNLSGGGFDKEYAPIDEPMDDAVFESRTGAEIRWFKNKSVRTDRWIDFSYHFNYRNSVIYAQTFINSPVKQEVILATGVSGSLKIWLNNQLAGSIREERNTDFDVYNYRVQLSAGINRILIQIGESEAGRSNFMLRITDNQMNPVTNITANNQYQAFVSDDIHPAQVGLFAEEYLIRELQNKPGDLLTLILLAECYMRNDKNSESLRLFLQQRQIAPQNSYIGLRLIENYARSDNRFEMSKEIEKIKQTDPNLYMSLLYQINEEEQKENHSMVEYLINKLETLYNINETALNRRINLYSATKQNNKLIELVNKAYTLYPANTGFVKLKAMIDLDVLKNNKSAYQVLKSYSNKYFNDEIENMLASYLLNQGKTKQGLKTYENLVNTIPYATGYYYKLAGVCRDLREYSKAIQYIRSALEMAPYTGAYYSRMGQIYDDINYTEPAIRAYEASLAYTPSDYVTRRALRRLEGKKDVFNYFSPVDIYREYALSPGPEAYPNDNSIILHYETQKIVYGGATEERHIILIKILKPEGIDNWKEYMIQFNQYNKKLIIEKAEIIKNNGNRITAESNNGYVVFTGLEVNDAIHLVYRLEDYSPDKLAMHFWDKFYFNLYYPVGISRYCLLIAKDKEFKYELLNTTVEPVIKSEDEFMLYTWEKKNLPAILPEDNAPPLSDIAQSLHLSSIPGWEFISNWYADLSAAKQESNFEIKQTVEKLLAGRDNWSDQAKADAIYQYIVKNIRYSFVPFRQGSYIPQKASTTLNTRLGDCKDLSTLFVSMARYAGLDAGLVLIDTRENGQKDMIVPSMEFNHCIARITIDNTEKFVELTNPYLSFGSMTGSLRGALSLNIPKPQSHKTGETIRYLNQEKSTFSGITRRTTITVKGNDLNIKRMNIRTGELAAQLRSSDLPSSQADREKGFQQSISKEFSSQTKIGRLHYVNLDTLTDTLMYEYEFTVKNAIKEIANIKIITIPWTDKKQSLDFIAEEDRKYDFSFLDVNSADVLSEEITIIFPQSVRILELPKTESFTFRGLGYSISCTYTDSTLTCNRYFKSQTEWIKSEDWYGFKDFFQKIVESDNRQIAIAREE